MLASKLIRAVVLWLIINLRSCNAQIDQTLCPQGPITSKDPKWPDISDRFEVSIELVSTEEATELVQTFSNQRDTITLTVNKGQSDILALQLGIHFFYDLLARSKNIRVLISYFSIIFL